MRSRTRLFWSGCGPVLFGMMFAVAKGQGDGLRNALGNVSAPWLVLPFAVGALWPRAGRAAVAGAAATVVALVGFYGTLSFIYDLAPNPWYVDVQRTFRAGSLYFGPGVVTGLMFGALGGLWGRYRLLPAALVATLALVCEPLALHAVGIDRGSGSPLRYPSLWAAEVLLGALLSLWAVSSRRPAAMRELASAVRSRLGV